MDKYPDELPWKERVYWYLHNIIVHPTCKICGKPTNYINPKYGYTAYCSIKCSNSDTDKKIKTKETCKKKYGGSSPAASKTVRDRMQQSCVEKYGVPNAMQNESVKRKSNLRNIELYGGCGNASDVNKKKYEETCKKKYGVSNPMKNPECLEYVRSIQKGVKEKLRNTVRERYGVDSYSQTDEYKKKIYETKKKNGTFNTSKIEQEFKKWLDDNHINYKYQYRSDSYPFNCDFYFPDKDLYFEIQGSWVHNDHPYNSDSPQDQIILNEWVKKKTKFYNNAIETWTVRDPTKRQWAKEHELNWVEVFSTDLDVVIQKYKEIIYGCS
jgi:hypothetical protein